MGISATDIKLRKSQRLTDFPDGGGRMVAAEVVDGQLNNLFPDISTQDRVAGRVSMRKAFVHVDTANTDMLYGAVGVIVDPPDDSNVGMTMFSTGSYADTRTDARNRIESYVIKGVESRYVLMGDHFIGQRSITVYCMQDAPQPEINQTFCLSVEKAGYAPDVQFVRVEEVVSRTTQTFYDGVGGDFQFQRDVIVIAITTALQFDFPGQEVSRLTSIKPPTRVRMTSVADASSYFSIKPIIGTPEAGDVQVKVSDPYVHLVPTTQAETPIVDVLAGMGTLSLIESGEPGSLTLAFSATFGAGEPVTRYLGTPCAKGSVTVVAGATTLTDDGRGALAAEGASLWSGQVDYVAGTVTLIHTAGVGNTAVTVTATPAGPVLMQGYTDRIKITSLNRQLNYIMQLETLPYGGTVTLDYMALGKWIRLTDDGLGRLTGLPGQGSGTVNYTTGSLVATLGALPDINSTIIVSYGTGVVTERRDQDVAITPPALQVQLPAVDTATAAAPGSVSVDYVVGGLTKTATDAASPGVLKESGVAVGAVDYVQRLATVAPPTMPDATAPVSASASVLVNEAEAFTPTQDTFGVVNLALGANVQPGSIKFSWPAQQVVSINVGQPSYKLVQLVAVDDGAGNIIGKTVGGAVWPGDGENPIGSISYATGVASLKVGKILKNTTSIPVVEAYWDDSTVRFRTVTLKQGGEIAFTNGSPVNTTWQVTGTASTPIDVTYPPPGDPLPPPPPPPAPGDPPLPPQPPAPIDLGIDLTPGTDDPIVPGSVRFVYRGKTYVDRSGGLYHSIDPVNGSGIYAGTIDYATGRAKLVAWEKGGANTISVQSLLVRFNESGQQHIEFRTPGAPLRAGSFTLRANLLDGTLLTATADLNGDITGSKVTGDIDWRTGSAQVRFGEMVTAAGNEAEPWYDPGAVVGGQIFKPALVNPATAFFGTVAYRNIPLNPALLGLDPVRLPEDGRVVVFRPGQTLLIHHTQETSVASPTAAQVVNLGRPNLTRVEVRDSAGTPILSSWYTVDKTAGTVTFSDPLNLTGYTLPVVIRDRIEDRVLCADSQITGEIGINRGLSHDYPAGSYLSTCLILGEMNGSQDLQGRVENIFDQKTWTAVFSDQRIGDGTDAQYNDVVYPIVVDNANAITERWAIHFTSASSFEIIGEASGIIGTGSTALTCAPPNPRTGQPYFTIPKEGWGAGWGTGNVLRFNTVGGLAPVWFIRTVLAGEATAPYDGFRYETIGDANP